MQNDLEHRPSPSGVAIRKAVTAFLPITFLAGMLLSIAGTPAGASKHAKALKPVGTTFAFPDANAAVVNVTLLKVVNGAPPKKKYHGLVGKGPVIGLEYELKNISATPASLSLFSSILYYATTVTSETKSLGATTLGPSLSLATLAPNKERSGWITVQGSKKSLVRIQATLNGTNTASWKG